jgi:hypothetical protein
MSRIYGGIHFMSANRDGKTCGARIGEFVTQNFLLPNNRLPMLRLESLATHPFAFRIHGYVGQPFVVEASDDVTEWQPVATNVAVVGGIVFAETNHLSNPRRFYRVREQ